MVSEICVYNQSLIHFLTLYSSAHAVTVFQGKLFLTGGKGQYQPYYNLDTRNSNGDVWYTEDGGMISFLSLINFINPFVDVHASFCKLFGYRIHS
jgi:hypothetical protein